MNKRRATAHIECNSTGDFFVYTDEVFPFGVHGEGDTAEQAKADFVATFKGFSERHKERTGETVEAEFEFVYDMSAILQECKAYISFAGLAKITGVSTAILSQYACGTRRPRPQMRNRIIAGIHQIGRNCLAVVG